MVDMTLESVLILPLLIGLFAGLYSSVGHGGASGYLAAMALFGLAPEVMRPAALALNILVASVALYKFAGAGYFSWLLFWKCSLFSIPFAFFGGLLSLPGVIYKPFIGAVLLYAAWRFLTKTTLSFRTEIKPPSTGVILGTGAVLGFLSGLSGVGGGIFLSPLLLFFGWSELKTVSGIAAAFILVNSIAGLAGVLTLNPELPWVLPVWAVAAVTGGVIGSEYGSRKLGNPMLKKLLGVVLIVAGIKMISGA